MQYCTLYWRLTFLPLLSLHTVIFVISAFRTIAISSSLHLLSRLKRCYRLSSCLRRYHDPFENYEFFSDTCIRVIHIDVTRLQHCTLDSFIFILFCYAASRIFLHLSRICFTRTFSVRLVFRPVTVPSIFFYARRRAIFFSLYVI